MNSINNFAKIIAVIVVLISCKTKTRQNDLDKLGLFGKVKEMRESEYDGIEKFGEIEKGNSKMLGTTTYSFNEKGNLIEQIVYDGQKIYQKRKFIYNSNGLISEMNIYQDTYTKEGDLINKFKYEYEREGDNVLESAYNGQGKFVFKIVKTYDSEHKILEEQISQNETLLKIVPNWKKRYSYDKAGNKTQMIYFSPIDIVNYKEFYTYEGTKVNSRKFSSNQPIFYKYDENSNLVEERNTEPSLAYIHRFRYNYDKDRNWTKRIAYYYDKLFSITEREIEYYK